MFGWKNSKVKRLKDKHKKIERLGNMKIIATLASRFQNNERFPSYTNIHKLFLLFRRI